MKIVALAAAMAMGLAGAPFALAQTTNTTNTPNTTDAPQQNQGMRQQMQLDLQKAGFTDISITPQSYFVRAKDRAGNPVMIAVDPNSVEEVAFQSAGVAANGQTDKAADQHGMFRTVPSGDKLSSNLVGLNVYNGANQDIGTIKDIGMGPNGVQSYILAVGGFLGMGDHYVAVNPAAVKVSYNSSEKKWHAEMNANADQLKAAPEFKYTGAWDGGKS